MSTLSSLPTFNSVNNVNIIINDNSFNIVNIVNNIVYIFNNIDTEYFEIPEYLWDLKVCWKCQKSKKNVKNVNDYT